MKIGVDMDEVIAEFLFSFLEFHNEAYGTDVAKDQVPDYFGLEQLLGCTTDEVKERILAFHETQHFSDIKPVEGAKDAITKLKRDHDLFIITARQDSVAEKTMRWLEVHFPDIFSGVHFMNHFSNDNVERSKREICDAIGIDIMIEDSLRYAEEIVTEHRPVFLLDRPWNRCDDLPPGITRVSSWPELLRKI